MKKLIFGIGLVLICSGAITSISKGDQLKASTQETENQSQQLTTGTSETTEKSIILESSIVIEESIDSSMNPIYTNEETFMSEEAISTEHSTGKETEQTNSSIEESTTDTSSEEGATQTNSSDSAVTSSSTAIKEATEPTKEASKEFGSIPTEDTSVANDIVKSEEVKKRPIINNSFLPAAPIYEQVVPITREPYPTGSYEVKLAENLKVKEVAESDLNGYELPLLSSFTDKRQALLIYEGLRHLGEKKDGYSIESLLKDIYSSLFNQDINESTKEMVSEEELQSGDIVLVKNERVGLYLGEGYYLTVETIDSKEPLPKVVVKNFFEKEGTDTIWGQRLSLLKKTDYAKEIEASYPASFEILKNDHTQKFIEQIGLDAQKLGLKYDVFASVMIAQAIVESGSGSSGLSIAPNYNLFGIKGTYAGKFVSMSTQEDRGNGQLYTISATFRRYPNYAASLGDYVTLIREGITGNEKYYQEVWRSKAKNYLRAASSLTGKYATDTSYHRKLSSIIAAYHLTQYDKKLPEDTEKNLLGTPSIGLFLQSKSTIPEEYRKKMILPDYNGKNYNTSSSYPVGQCTWYAFNRIAQLGGHVDDYMGNGGEWGDKGRRLGYEITQQPKIGYAISFTPGVAGSDPRYGHVAIVEAVTDSGILISEGNVVGGTVISYRIIPNELAKSNLVSYIKPK